MWCRYIRKGATDSKRVDQLACYYENGVAQMVRNHPTLVDSIPQNKRQMKELTLDKEKHLIKTLGLSLDVNSDKFKISCPLTSVDNSVENRNTKIRQILAFIAKFYDPLGLIGPIIVAAKVITQKVWRANLGWDDQLPDHLSCESKRLATSLKDMARRKDTGVKITLLCSKSRIAPISQKLTIPKLGLNSAVLLVKLVNYKQKFVGYTYTQFLR
uniref:Reverse transcriptase domain-containing protein n=1 Tax=Photinus pyralis TaxID=7054 RepID=A0A1Y1MX06_PHOPY